MTDSFFAGIDEAHRIRKVEKLEWEYREMLHSLTTETLNKNNTRIYQPKEQN